MRPLPAGAELGEGGLVHRGLRVEEVLKRVHRSTEDGAPTGHARSPACTRTYVTADWDRNWEQHGRWAIAWNDGGAGVGRAVPAPDRRLHPGDHAGAPGGLARGGAAEDIWPHDRRVAVKAMQRVMKEARQGVERE